MPITVSDKAAGQLAALIGEQGKARAMLRVWVAGLGCSGLRYGMGIDEKDPEEGDRIFESSGVKIVVDPQSLSFMDGSTVDWVDDAENGGFSIENPNPPPQKDCDCSSGVCGVSSEDAAQGAASPCERGDCDCC